jgi:hypothetical protein
VDITKGGQPDDPDCTGDAYCVTSSGFYGEGVSISVNDSGTGSGSWTYTCDGCTGSEIIKVEFVDGHEFTGTAVPVAPDGTQGGSLPYNGSLNGGCSLSDHGSFTSAMIAHMRSATKPLVIEKASPVARIASLSYYVGSARGQTFNGSWDCNTKELRVGWSAAVPCKQKSAPALAPVIEKVFFDFKGRTSHDGAMKRALSTDKLVTGKVYEAVLDGVRATATSMSFSFHVHLVEHPGHEEVYDCHIEGNATLPSTS